MSAAGQAPVLLLVLLLAWAVPDRVSGQGLRTDSSRAGATQVKAEALLPAWKRQMSQARNLAQLYQRKKKGSCVGQVTGRMCSQDVASAEASAALRIATSPPVYDTRNASHTGGLVLAPLPRDQGACNSCVGWSLAAAAQSAAAAALRVSVSSKTVPLISVRQLLFCNAHMDGDCVRGWYLDQAVALLSGRSQQPAACVQGFTANSCLDMPSDRTKMSVAAGNCQVRQCSVKLPRGSYSYTKLVPLEDIWQMQQHIRTYGASVVTRMMLPSGFKQWFDSEKRKRAVYAGPGAGAVQAELAGGEAVNHAVVLAGYNNIEEYWIVWSPWGNWADRGFARVRFGQLAIGEPKFTYGIMFNPTNPPQPPSALVEDTKLAPNCQWYQVQRGDYVSKVADTLRLPVEGLLQQNVQRIPDLGAWLKPGQRLQACDVSGRSNNLTVSVAQAAAVSSETTCVTADTKEVRWTLTSAKSVPASETPSGKKWEYFHTYGFSQSGAENVCVQLGGHLVTIDSNRTNQMLFDKFVVQHMYAKDGIWIGLTAQQPTTDRSKWSWLSGSKTSYVNWGIGERGPHPDNWDGKQGQCAVLGPNIKPTGSWDDFWCNWGLPFVCEFAPSVTKKTNQAQITVRVLKSATAPDGKLWAFFFFNVVPAAAQSYCKQSGGNLVTVDSAQKTKFLIEHFLDRVNDIAQGVWIGLYMPATGADPTDKSQYMWHSGAPTDTYSNWAYDQPDGDTRDRLGSPSCVHVIDTGDEHRPGGTWNDVSCDKDVNPRPFICEYAQS